MRPSNSVTFEPGVERGVPWGHDLFTFVTSAAGHMMRTLQRPRKNRPSKRQVNHRRFLHNMIQRKFAEIETANHQLASVLFSAEVANSDTPSPSRQPITTDLSNSTSKEAPVSAEADLSLCSHETEALATDQNDPGDQWRLNPKRLQMDLSNSNTPNSCDFGVTTVEDNAACSQSQNNMADSETVESQRMDVLRLWDSEVEPQNDGGFRDGMDPQAHLETIWGSPGEERSLANNVHVDDITFLNQSESFIEKLMLHTSSSSDARSEMEQIDCDRGQYEYGSGYRCSIDPVTAIRDFISGQGSSQCMLESAVGRQEGGVGVPGPVPGPVPEEGVGEGGGSSESEFSHDRSSTNALRPERIPRGNGARLGGREVGERVMEMERR
ncbi:unnamed protein product [Coregonus sp. 'balchen']|nr:unnamed protein product [Coregonus sp. 'balchen']